MRLESEEEGSLILVIDIDAVLTMREQQILYYVARGLSNKEISAKLSLSEQTVKVHLANMLSHTGCPNRAALVSYGFERGILRNR